MSSTVTSVSPNSSESGDRIVGIAVLTPSQLLVLSSIASPPWIRIMTYGSPFQGPTDLYLLSDGTAHDFSKAGEKRLLGPQMRTTT